MRHATAVAIRSQPFGMNIRVSLALADKPAAVASTGVRMYAVIIAFTSLIA